MIDEHKVEELYDLNKRLWINDSKATNVDATINALVPYKEKEIHIILGGDDKGANLEPLFDNIKELNITVYAIGSNVNRIISLCKEYSINYIECNFLINAVEEISLNLPSNGVGMLSPAAASLDQFPSYAARGKEFKKLVKNLSLN